MSRRSASSAVREVIDVESMIEPEVSRESIEQLRGMLGDSVSTERSIQQINNTNKHWTIVGENK